MTRTDWALKYLRELHWSVIPQWEDRSCPIKWSPYRDRLPTEDEIRDWGIKWAGCNWAVVCGKISGVTAFDIDTREAKERALELLPDSMNYPCCQSPGGSHYYFKYCAELNGIKSYRGIEIKNNGLLLTVPPSSRDKILYGWIRSPFDNAVPVLPKEVIDKIKAEAPAGPIGRVTNGDGQLNWDEGHRDETLFFVANRMIRGGMTKEVAEDALLRLASTCRPPFPADQALEKVKSAVDRADKREHPMAEKVKEFVRLSDGTFNITDIFGHFHVITPEEKNNIYVILHRLSEEGVIERAGDRSGSYRRIRRECDEMNWSEAETTPLKVRFPFKEESLVDIYPTNLIVSAGSQNSGKTAWLLNCAKLNKDKFDVHYFQSEMGEAELKLRLSKFQGDDGRPVDWSRVKFYERSDHFEDVIRPDGINIIDYLEMDDSFWAIGKILRVIFTKLKKGIAIIGLQKDYRRDTGRGDSFSLEKPRLYLALDAHRIKIVKAKNWKSRENPNGKELTFKLHNGAMFEPLTSWHYPEMK